MWFLHQRFYQHFQFCSARRWCNYSDFLLHASHRISYLHTNCAGIFALININFSTMDFVPLRAWDSSCVVVCFSRWIVVKFMLQFPRLYRWRCLVRARFLSSSRRSVEELDIRETLNLATIKVRKSFSLVMQSLFYSNNSLRNFQTFIKIVYWSIEKRMAIRFVSIYKFLLNDVQSIFFHVTRIYIPHIRNFSIIFARKHEDSRVLFDDDSARESEPGQ